MTDWLAVLTKCGVRASTAAKWAPIFAAEIGPNTFSLGMSEVDDFLGQVLHESAMLERLEEGLYYKTPGRLMAIWPTRFKSLADERPFLCNPEALANKVYGGRMGNIEFGDGWRFRGRSLIQVTGRDNYRTVGDAIGVNLINYPAKLSEPGVALKASIAWWESKVPDSAMGDIRRITKVVNGGVTALVDRVSITNKAKSSLSGLA